MSYNHIISVVDTNYGSNDICDQNERHFSLNHPVYQLFSPDLCYVPYPDWATIRSHAVRIAIQIGDTTRTLGSCTRHFTYGIFTSGLNSSLNILRSKFMKILFIWVLVQRSSFYVKLQTIKAIVNSSFEDL